MTKKVGGGNTCKSQEVAECPGKWLWASTKPGLSVLPCKSTIVDPDRAKLCISTSSPIATIIPWSHDERQTKKDGDKERAIFFSGGGGWEYDGIFG
jgi:hypothetical protein